VVSSKRPADRMSIDAPGPSVRVRPYRDEDEPGVLELLAVALGAGPAGRRPPEFFRWKHLENPFGRSFMLVAEAEDRIVGFRAFLRWRFTAGSTVLHAVRAVDTATHPNYQGQGIFTRLTLEALHQLTGNTDFVFNTPNAKSLPGYLKMGWRVVGRVPILIRPRRPLRFVVRSASLRTVATGAGDPPAPDAETAAEGMGSPEDLQQLLESSANDGMRIGTERSVEYLRWRYGAAPLLDYRAVRESVGQRTSGLAIFRVRPRGRLWETTMVELIVHPEDVRTARRLVRRVVHAAAVDHVTGHFPSRSASARACLQTGFVRSPGGMTLVVNPLSGSLEPDPSDLRSWSLSLGDLEVF
jgi:GNAT superfamily N-acetyltransferase